MELTIGSRVSGSGVNFKVEGEFMQHTGKGVSRDRESWILAGVIGAVLVTGLLKALFGQQPSQEQLEPSSSLRHFPTPLAGDLPYDVDVQKVSKLDVRGEILAAQREFDILAWQAFIALNWPANEEGKPEYGKDIADISSPRVWDFWRPASTIFLPDGEKPQPWQTTNAPAAELTLFRTKAAWRQHSTSADENFEAFSGPLVDQNGKWVRYEVLVNHEEFDYLMENELYSLDGQAAFSQRAQRNQVEFPINEGTKKHGAIEIKLAWKELGHNDDRSRFYTARLKVALAEPYKAGQTEPATKEIEAGLVGMHIAMRTESSPEWVWATFEQIDNVRVNRDAAGRVVHPNFFDPVHPQPVNLLAPRNAVLDQKTGHPVIVNDNTPDTPTATTWVESLTTTPVQVARIEVPTQGQLNPWDAKIAETTKALNSEVQRLLRDMASVFQYYELIGTQWPIHPDAPAFAGGDQSAPDSITHKTPGDMVPVFLVNTTMETYFQKGQQPAGPLEQDDRLPQGSPPIDNTSVFGTESCIGCHYSAGICLGFKKGTDGSYLLDKVTGERTPIFGENGNFGKNGNANLSWLLQIEAHSKPYSPPGKVEPVKSAPAKNPAKFMDIEKFLEERLKGGKKLKPLSLGN